MTYSTLFVFMHSTLSEVVSMKTNGQCRIHQRPKRGSRAREAGLQVKTRAPVRNGPATFWLQCDDYCTIHDPHPLANSWKRREAGPAWAQIAVPKTTPVPQHHLCTSLYLFDQLKAIHGTCSGRESMQLTLHEVDEEHICAIAGNEEVKEAETVGVP